MLCDEQTVVRTTQSQGVVRIKFKCPPAYITYRGIRYYPQEGPCVVLRGKKIDVRDIV